MSSLRSFFKDTALYGIASVLPRIVSFALVGVYTEVFDASAFSSQTKWYVYAAFLNIILTLGVETSFFRFFSVSASAPSALGNQKRYDKGQVLSTGFFLIAASSLLFILLAFAFQDALTRFFGFQDASFLHLLVGITVFDTLVVIPFALIRAEGKTFRFLTLKVLNILVMAGVTVWLLILLPAGKGMWQWLCLFPDCLQDFKPQVIHIFVANGIASALTCILVFPELRRIRFPENRQLLLDMLQYSWPVMVGGLAFVANENADKLLIARWSGEEANGIYAACYKLGVFMTLYITAFRMGAEPFFFSHAHKEDARIKYSKIMTWFVIFGSVFMVAVVINIDWLASLFLRQKVYLSGLAIVPVILLANLFSGIYTNLSVWYKLSDRTQFGMYISILGGVLTLVTLWLLVPKWGIFGGALSTLSTYAMMAAISWYFGQRMYPVPYQTGRLLCIISLAFGTSLLSFFVFRENFPARLALLGVFLITLIWMEKKEIQALVRGES